MHRLRSPWLIPVIVFLIVAASLGLLLLRPSLFRPPLLLPVFSPPASQTVSVTSVSGKPALANQTPLTPGSALSETDTVLLPASAQVVFTFSDRTQLALTGPAQLTFLHLQPELFLIRLDSGSLSVTPPLVTSARLDIQTSAVTLQSSAAPFSLFLASSSAQITSAARPLHLILPDLSSLTLPPFTLWSSAAPDLFTPQPSPLPTSTPPVSPSPSSPSPSPSPAPAISSPPASSADTYITLTATSLSPSSARLIWNIDGSAPSGFILLSSSSPQPVYPPRPTDTATFVTDPATRQFTLTDLPSPVYLRLCVSLTSACGTYSNQIYLTP